MAADIISVSKSCSAADYNVRTDEKLRSSKNLWILISGSSLTSKDLIGSDLEANLDKIANGLDMYRLPSATSAKKLRENKDIDGKVCNSILELAKFMNLDELQCYELFCDYLLFEYRGTDESLRAVVSNERHLQNLMTQIWDYYCRERLYLLLCIKEILVKRQDKTHLHNDLYEDFFCALTESFKLENLLVAQWISLTKVNLFGSKSHSSFLGDDQIQTWLVFALREQCELLQILLLYFDANPCSVRSFNTLLDSFKENGFRCSQHGAQLSDNSPTEILRAIGYLQCLIVMKNLRLDSLESPNGGQTYFLNSATDIWSDSDKRMHRLGNPKHHSPLLLCWMLVRHKILGINDAVATQSLGKLGLESGAFSFLDDLLQSPVFQGGGVIARIAHSVTFDLVNALLDHFEASSIGNSLTFDNVVRTLMKEKINSERILKLGFDRGMGVLVSSAADRFPYQFSSLVSLLAAMAEGSPKSSAEASKFFGQLSSITLPLTPSVKFEEVWLEDCASLCLEDDFYPYGTETVLIKKDTLGSQIPELNDNHIIQWHQPVNGWQVCLAFVDQLLQDMRAGADNILASTNCDISSLIQLVRAIISQDPDAFFSLELLVEHIFLVVQRLSDLQQPPMEIIALSLELSACVRGIAAIDNVWWKVILAGVLPTNPSFLDSRSSEKDHFRGSVSSIIASQECVVGQYPTTIAFLRLISSFTEAMSEKGDQHFVACVAYVGREIFPSYTRWWYKNVSVREQIAQKCLEIFHNILRIPLSGKLPTGQEARESPQSVVLKSLLHQDAGHALLQMICTGEESIHRALERQASWAYGQGLELLRAVQLSLSVLNRLLIMWSLGKKETCSLVTLLCSNPTTVRTVANYIYHRFSPRLATLAVLLMKRFAQELPISLLICLGSEYEGFCKRLLLRLESQSEDVQLKTAIWRFITVCVECQPGMTEAFLGFDLGNDGMNRAQKAKDAPHSRCLQVIVINLNNYKKHPMICPEELRCGVLSFLRALWVGRQIVALDDLQKCSDFWVTLIDPLFSNDPCTLPKAVAITFTILAHEFLICEQLERKLHTSLEDAMSKISAGGYIVKWTEKILERCVTKKDEASMDTSIQTSISETNTDGIDNLLGSWSDFLIIGAKTNNVKLLPHERSEILEIILDTLVDLLGHGENKYLFTRLSETLLHLLKLWQEKCSALSTSFMKQFGMLLNALLTTGDSIPLHVVVDVLAACVLVLPNEAPKQTDFHQSITFWMELVVNITYQSIFAAEKSISEGSVVGIQMTILCAQLLQKLIWLHSDGEAWLPYLQRTSLVNALLGLVAGFLHFKKGADGCCAILNLFACFAAFSKTSEALVSANLVETLCLPLTNLDLGQDCGHFERAGSLMKDDSPNASWSDVYRCAIRVVTTLLQTQHHFVIEASLDFACVHLPTFRSIPTFVHKHPSLANLNIALAVLELIKRLTQYPHIWKLHSRASLGELIEISSNVCNISVAFLLRPRALLLASGQIKQEEGMKSLKDDDHSLLQHQSSMEEFEKVNPKLFHVKTRLLKVTSSCISILCNFTPDLSELLSENGYNSCQWEPLLYVSFITPSLDQISHTSYGTLISVVTVCLKMLTMADKSPVHSSDTAALPNRQLITNILETSLYLILSQASLILLNNEQPLWDKQLFKQELGAELGSCVQSRYLRRGIGGISPSSGSAISPSQSRSRLPVEKLPFFSLVSSIVDSLFK